MKKIWYSIRLHIQEDFNTRHYTFMAGFLAIAIALNYTFRFDDDFLEPQRGWLKFVYYFLFYGMAYYGASLSYLHFSKQLYILMDKAYWIRSVLALTLLSLDSSVPFLQGWIEQLASPPVQFWAFKVGINLVSFLTILSPVIIFYWLYDRQHNHVYGLQPKQFDATPYFIMLLIMLPLIGGASFSESFTRQYPMYKSSQAHISLGVPEWVTAGMYELAYALDFVTVELLFRGFMVIGMMHVLGRGSVLIMATTYCFLHFGKPPMEAISSVFGGYILGAIAYETKSIWGGIIVHIGIAWMMELLAFLQRLL